MSSYSRRSGGSVRRRSVSKEVLARNIGSFETGTMLRNFWSIEGYLSKEIEAKGMLRRTKRHLRYFRIIFSTGKMNIKEDKVFN